MAVVTPKFSLITPQGVEIDNVPQWMLSLATQLDGLLAGCQSGTFASIPAASAGRFYYATDTVQLYVSDGSVWRSVMGLPAVPVGRWYLAPSGGVPGNVGLSDTFDGTTPKVIPWTVDWQANGFSTSGGTIVVPRPAIYRVHVQVAQAPSWQFFNAEQIEHRITLFQGESSGNPPGEPFAQVAYASIFGQMDSSLSTNSGVPGAPTRAGGYATSELTGLIALDGSFSTLTKMQIWASNSTVYGGAFGSALPCFQAYGGKMFTFVEVAEVLSLA